MSITQKPSEILIENKKLFEGQIYSGIPDYLWSEEVLQMESTLSEELYESALFLCEDQPNILEAFKASDARLELERSLKDFASERTTWTSVSKAWDRFIEDAKKIEESLAIRVQKFSYRGFEVCTIQTPEYVLDIFKRAIDFLIDLFHTREVQIDLRTIISRFEFRPVHHTDKPKVGKGNKPGGAYGNGVVYLFWGLRSGLSPQETATIRGQVFNIIHYVIVHEVSHAIYFSALSPEAREFWRSDWVRLQVELNDLEDVIDPEMDYSEVLKELGIPTQYGHMNPKEDFAETLAHYVLDNDSLAPYAKNRLLGTLNHSSNSSRIFKTASKRYVRQASRPSHKR
jgi:hypothetical protein